MDDTGPAAHLISLGAGVQSSVMALMAAAGDITPMPAAAIFADTGWEPLQIYKHLDWLETMLPFPVHRVKFRGYRNEDQGDIRTQRGANQMPLFVAMPNGKRGMVRRQCTDDYKIVPIMRKARDIIGVKRLGRIKNGIYVDQWLGISTDEIGRVKPSLQQWVHRRYPLIELNMTREDCINYFQERFPGRTLERSACVGCPYHTNAEWDRMKTHDPVSWTEAVEFDHNLRNGTFKLSYDYPAYLHNSRIPLDYVDFGMNNSGEDFSVECEGMCGN